MHPQTPTPKSHFPNRPTPFLWIALALLPLLLVPACSLVAYVSLSGQTISLGGDDMRVDVYSVPVRPSDPLIHTSKRSHSQGHCSGGRCTESKCATNELFISSLKIDFTQCVTTTTP